MSFAGSLESGNAFTLRPRVAARRQMARALAAAAREQPGLRVELSTSGPFANAEQMLDGDAYTALLGRTRIALCPRGNFDETFRLFEAARAGCVAISETLPERWYYRDAPVVELRSWRSLPGVLDRLLADGDALEQRSEAMRDWWDTQLSEPAVAGYIASSLSPR